MRQSALRIATLEEVVYYGFESLPNGLVPPMMGGDGGYKALVLDDGATGYWRMNATSIGASSTETDIIGARNATYANVSGGYPVGGQTGALTGDPDTAVQFNQSGTSNYATWAGDAFALNGSNWTVECWAKSSTGTDPATTQTFLEQYDNASTQLGWWVGALGADSTTNSGLLFINVYNPTNTFVWQLLGTGQKVTDGGWHHCVVTHKSGGGVLYVDGVLRSSNVNATSPAASSGGGLLMGTVAGATNSWVGYLDEVAIYTTVTLSSTQVAMHYAVGRGARFAQSGARQVPMQAAVR